MGGNAFYRGADACVLVYDVTNEQTFQKIEEWKSNFLEQSGTEYPEKFPFLLLETRSIWMTEEQFKKTKPERMPEIIISFFMKPLLSMDKTSRKPFVRFQTKHLKWTLHRSSTLRCSIMKLLKRHLRTMTLPQQIQQHQVVLVSFSRAEEGRGILNLEWWEFSVQNQLVSFDGDY